jgi:hypothetical protein
MDLTPERAEEWVHRGIESPDLDYKLDFDDSLGAWMELAKDIYGLSNYGGGAIVIGIKDGTFQPIGLDPTFHKDVQKWVDKVSTWATGNIEISYLEHITKVDGTDRKFPILYVKGSIGTFVIPKTDGTYPDQYGVRSTAFRQGVTYTRRETSTVSASGDEVWHMFWGLLQRTAVGTGSQGVPLGILSALRDRAQADTVEETLWFNLFPVTEIPDFIHSGVTDMRDAGEIYRIAREKMQLEDRALTIPPFLLEDGKIYTFSVFNQENPLRVCVREAASVNTKTWFGEKYRTKLVKLLNFYLRDLCRSKGLGYDLKRERYFRMYRGGVIPEVIWKPHKKMSTRQLVYQKVNAEGRLLYYEHFAGRLRFILLGDGIYLVVEPIRVLTSDGENPLDQYLNVRISTHKNAQYHNNNYLYDTKFWLHLLAGNSTEILMGPEPNSVRVSVSPVSGKVNFGILQDQHTDEDFLDALRSEPFEYVIGDEESEEDNPLTEAPLEE